MAAQPSSEPQVELDLAPVPLPLKRWDDGSIRVRGSRLTLETIVVAHNGLAYSPEEIARNFGDTPVETVYAVLAFYLANREAVDAYVARREAEAQAFLEQWEAKHPQDGMKEQLLARKAEREVSSAPA